MADLPDYTRYISFNATLPTPEVDVEGPVVYLSAPGDLADGERAPALADIKRRVYVRLYGEEPTTGIAQVIARPKGGVIATGSVATTGVYQTVASRTVTSGKSFQLAKILISCDQDVIYKLRWNAGDISAEVYVAGRVPFPDWFPWGYYAMLGDGSKAFDVQAKYPSGGSAGTCRVEIVGEEV